MEIMEITHATPSGGTLTAIIIGIMVQSTPVVVSCLCNLLFIQELTFIGADYHSLLNLSNELADLIGEIDYLKRQLASFHNSLPLDSPHRVGLLLKCGRLAFLRGELALIHDSILDKISSSL